MLRHQTRFVWGITLLAPVILLLSACGNGTHQANIELRKQVQDLTTRIDQFERRHDADQATILSLQSLATTVPILPQDQIDQLFTVHGLSLGRLTGGGRDPGQPFDTMVKVYVVPTDGDGEDIKAAGSFSIELFDLALASANRIGKWDFDVSQARRHWVGHGLIYSYLLPCAFQTTPAHAKLLLRTTFVDSLTHRSFTKDREIIVNLPDSTTTQPATGH